MPETETLVPLEDVCPTALKVHDLTAAQVALMGRKIYIKLLEHTAVFAEH
jgi:hypothetical protein